MKFTSTIVTSFALASQAFAQNASTALGNTGVKSGIIRNPPAASSGSSPADAEPKSGEFLNSTAASLPTYSVNTENTSTNIVSESPVSKTTPGDDYPLPTNLPNNTPIFSCPVGGKNEPGLNYNIFALSETLSNQASLNNLAADIRRQGPISSGRRIQTPEEIQAILAGEPRGRVGFEMTGYFIPPRTGKYYFSENSNTYSSLQLGAGSRCASEIQDPNLTRLNQLLGTGRFGRRSDKPIEVTLSSDYSYPARYFAFYEGGDMPSLSIVGPDGEVDLSCFSQRKFEKEEVPSIPDTGAIIDCGDCEAVTETVRETSYVTICEERANATQTTYITDCEYTGEAGPASGPHVVVVNGGNKKTQYSTVTRTSYTTIPCDNGEFTTSEIVYVTEVCDACDKAEPTPSKEAPVNGFRGNNTQNGGKGDSPKSVEAVAGPNNSTGEASRSGSAIGLSNAGISVKPELISVFAMAALLI